MGSQVKLQWTSASTGAGVTQVVERKIGTDAWATAVDNAAIIAGEGNAFSATDPADYAEDTTVTYRIKTANAVYSVTGNELVINVPATLAPVGDLTGGVEETP